MNTPTAPPPAGVSRLSHNLRLWIEHISNLLAELQQEDQRQRAEFGPNQQPQTFRLVCPPGLHGRIADFVHESAALFKLYNANFGNPIRPKVPYEEADYHFNTTTFYFAFDWFDIYDRFCRFCDRIDLKVSTSPDAPLMSSKMPPLMSREKLYLIKHIHATVRCNAQWQDHDLRALEKFLATSDWASPDGRHDHVKGLLHNDKKGELETLVLLLDRADGVTAALQMKMTFKKDEMVSLAELRNALNPNIVGDPMPVIRTVFQSWSCT